MALSAAILACWGRLGSSRGRKDKRSKATSVSFPSTTFSTRARLLGAVHTASDSYRTGWSSHRRPTALRAPIARTLLAVLLAALTNPPGVRFTHRDDKAVVSTSELTLLSSHSGLERRDDFSRTTSPSHSRSTFSARLRALQPHATGPDLSSNGALLWTCNETRPDDGRAIKLWILKRELPHFSREGLANT